jgi:hypothetical protein
VSSGPAGPRNAALGNHLDLKATTRFTGFGVVTQATVSPQADQLLITASGNDPSIVLPPVALNPPIQFALRVDLTTPADTLVEVFYSTNTVPSFVPEHVVSVPAKAGKNVLLFEVNDPEFAGALRFDPGQVPGQYILHGMEIFSSGPIAIAKPTPSPSPSSAGKP